MSYDVSELKVTDQLNTAYAEFCHFDQLTVDSLSIFLICIHLCRFPMLLFFMQSVFTVLHWDNFRSQQQGTLHTDHTPKEGRDYCPGLSATVVPVILAGSEMRHSCGDQPLGILTLTSWPFLFHSWLCSPIVRESSQRSGSYLLLGLVGSGFHEFSYHISTPL